MLSESSGAYELSQGITVLCKVFSATVPTHTCSSGGVEGQVGKRVSSVHFSARHRRHSTTRAFVITLIIIVVTR